MMKSRQLKHVESDQVLLSRLRWCDTFAAKLRGFTFQRELKSTDGLVLVEKSDSRVSTAIHMLFVNFALGVVWVNGVGQVVDMVVAQPWRLSYAPKSPARYVVELHPDLLQQIRIGDHLQFLEPSA